MAARKPLTQTINPFSSTDQKVKPGKKVKRKRKPKGKKR